MRDHLVFTLAAPLASFGDPAGHERRGSAPWPGRSAVLGLVGAALGIDRSDREGQAALADGYGMAVLTRAPGLPLRDYHTVQTVPTAKVRRPATRAAALAAAGREVNTTITIRDYRADVAFEVALWQRDAAGWSLAQLADALRRPVHLLWLGRKSCPLAAPLNPRLVAADDAPAAFRAAPPQEPAVVSRPPPVAPTIATDTDGVAEPPARAMRETRWDAPGDRLRWQFATREVWVFPVAEDTPS